MSFLNSSKNTVSSIAHKRIKPAIRTSRGLTLVELMVAVAVSMILFIGIAQIFVANKRAYRLQDDNSHIQENGRFATGMITQDLRRAGYYGANSDVLHIGGTQQIAIAANTCPNDNTWARMLLFPVAGKDNTNAGYACITAAEYNNGTDILVTRYTNSVPVPAASMDPGRPYLRTSLFYGRLFLGAEEANALNDLSSRPQVDQAIVARAYFVGPSGRTCPDGLGIPALFRKELGAGGALVTQEIASNIENLQVQYGVDTTGDSNIDRYLNANAVIDPTKIKAVRYWILVRAKCEQPPGTYTNNNPYVMGNVNFIPGDRYKRQLFTGTVSLRNQ